MAPPSIKWKRITNNHHLSAGKESPPACSRPPGSWEEVFLPRLLNPPPARAGYRSLPVSSGLTKGSFCGCFFLFEELTASFQGQRKSHQLVEGSKERQKAVRAGFQRGVFISHRRAGSWLPWQLTHLEPLTGISLK